MLAEEIGHYITTSGDILDDESPLSERQEQRARMWAYNTQIGLSGLIEAMEAGCKTFFEIAEHLGVTESFLADCLHRYHEKYGTEVEYGNYIIFFDPLEIMELGEDE